MTRPEMRAPRPGEMLRQAATRGSASARESTPWAAQAAGRGLRAVDREMLRLDARAWAAVEDAREHIRQAEADMREAEAQIGLLDGRMAETETAVQDAAQAVAVVRDETLPALTGRLDDAEATLGEWETGTLPALRSDLDTLRDETIPELEAIVGPLPGAVAAAQEDATRALADAAGKASVVAQPSAPQPDGDTLWIDTSDGNKPKVWTGVLGPEPRANLAPNTLTHVTSGTQPVMGTTAIIDGFLRLTSTQEGSPFLPRVQAVGTSSGRADVTPDTDYLISVEVRGQVDPDNRIEFRDYQMSAENQFQGRSGSYFAPSDGTWHTIRLVLRTLPDVTKLGWQIGSENPLAPGRYIDARNLFIEQSSDVDAVPFNGDSMGAEWTGTPGWSTSIYDGPAWVEVQDAGVQAALGRLDDVEGQVGTLQIDLDAAEAAVAMVRDVTLPALDSRLDTAEYDVKHISGEWITAGTVDTARLNAQTIAAAVATVIELNADRITAGLIQGDQINASSIAAAVGSFLELNADQITSGTIKAGQIDAVNIAAAVATVIELNANRITSGTIDTARLNAAEIAAATATLIELDAGRITSGTIDTARLSATEIWGEIATIGRIITDDLIATGAVTADALNVVSTSGAGHSWRLDETGLIAMHTASQAAMHLDSGGMRMWDQAGDLTVRLNGVQNLFTGSVRTVAPGGGRGVIIAQDGQDRPGVWLTSTGGGGDSVPGLRLALGVTPADDRLVIQGLERVRYRGWRAAVVAGSTTNQRGGARGPGQLSHSVNRDAPVTVAQESLFVRENGFYTVTFHANLGVRPSSSRAFLTLVRNAGTAARQTFGQEDFGTLTWFGWLASGDRLDFTTYFDGTGTYSQASIIGIIYHGE